MSDGLLPTEKEQLAQGEHAAVADALRRRGRSDLAAEILDEIWDFGAAVQAHLEAANPAGALSSALEAERPDLIDQVLDQLQRRSDPAVLGRAAAMLAARGRHAEAARLLARAGAPAEDRAGALERAGDGLGAAATLAAAGEPQQALALLERLGQDSAARWALQAQLSWELGDAQAVARAAQRALRRHGDTTQTRELLARALVALGHDVAAQLVLPEGERETHAVLPGRIRVTAPLPPSIAGAAYEGVNRVSLEAVEVHLLLAEQPGAANDPALVEALERFMDMARRGSRVGHPAIRTVLDTDARAGLLVLARADGPPLRQLIRPPGISPPRARAMIAFLLEGLVAASRQGLVHGSVIASQLVCDRVGRPLLGPFGTHWLRGLVATRTGSLDELVSSTAPELRGGGAPTAAGDVYALGVLWAALLCGQISRPAPSGPDAELIASMQADDPLARPDRETLLVRLRAPVAEVSELRSSAREDVAGARISATEVVAAIGVRVTASESWTDDELAALCAARDPWLQPILDRADRLFVLAPWPEGTRAMDAGATSDDTQWNALIPDAAFSNLPRAARHAVEARMRATSLVATASGEWMLALDDLLSR